GWLAPHDDRRRAGSRSAPDGRAGRPSGSLRAVSVRCAGPAGRCMAVSLPGDHDDARARSRGPRRRPRVMTIADRRVLVVTAHPDDPEFAAGGTVAKLVKDGCDVTYVIATNGNKGSSDPAAVPEWLARVREEEQRHAARILGVTRVEFLGHEDGELEDNRQLRLDVTREIRRSQPELIITSHPSRTFGNFFAWHRDYRI